VRSLDRLLIALAAPACLAALAVAAEPTRPASTPSAAACGKSKQVEQLSIGACHTCARLRDGGLECWGANAGGQLGDGTRRHRARPTLVAGLCGVTDVSAGGESTCVVLEDGSVRCWGHQSRKAKPTAVAGAVGIRQVAVGPVDACGLGRDGSIVCWGASFGGPKPWTVAIEDATVLTASQGPRPYFYAVRENATVWRWLGRGAPEQVGMPTAKRLSCGGDACCAILDDESVTCWDPATPSPAKVPQLHNIERISAGTKHRCVVLSDRRASCWGSNGMGRLGDGTETDRATPTPVPALSNLRQIVAGNLHSCALLQDGAVKCWGGTCKSGGVVGDGTDEKRLTPVDVAM